MTGISNWKNEGLASSRLFEGFDGLFADLDRFFASPHAAKMSPLSQQISPLTGQEDRLMACDVREDDQAFYFTVDLPGVRPEQIHVEVDRDFLNIKAERQAPAQPPEAARADDGGPGLRWRLRERRFGTVSRSFRLPEGTGADRVEAVFADGVLELRVPKPEVSKPVKVAIATKSPSAVPEAN